MKQETVTPKGEAVEEKNGMMISGKIKDEIGRILDMTGGSRVDQLPGGKPNGRLKGITNGLGMEDHDVANGEM